MNADKRRSNQICVHLRLSAAYINMRAATAVLAFLLAVGCSTSPNPPAKTAAKTGTPTRVAASSNPVAKYIELVGFRIGEEGPGKLRVKFGVVNHSEADIGNVVLSVNLRASTAKPDDPPLATFDAKVDGLGPSEMKEVSVIVPTKLRAYEVPDWQFLKTDFQIVEPK